MEVNDDDDDDLFIELMYGATTLTELVEQVLDLLRQVLVLPLYLHHHDDDDDHHQHHHNHSHHDAD